MTPKDKAKELFQKFCLVIKTEETEFGYFTNVIHAKECALIAVDEILFSNNTYFETNMPHECWKYWLEVKQEIEKL